MLSPRASRTSQRHYPAPLTIGAAITAIVLIALGATAVAPAGATGSAPVVALRGSGSTFDEPFFSAAFTAYAKEHSGVKINYDAVGSSAGIAALSGDKVNFGASDVPMTSGEEASAGGGPVVQVPVDLGAEDIVYNLDTPRKEVLHLTGPVLARIFLGQLTHWDDPAITRLNPGIKIPHAPINVVHRSDGSGTTYIFSNYLSSVDSAWASRVGTGTRLKWPVGVGARGNANVASTVFRTPFSIGYVESAYSRGLLLRVAAIRNRAGNYVVPTSRSIVAAAAEKPNITATNFSIVNEPGAQSYPITGYSWALVYAHQRDQATGLALVNMLDWLTHQGQTYAATNSYVPLPAPVRQYALSQLRQVTGPTGAHLLS